MDTEPLYVDGPQAKDCIPLGAAVSVSAQQPIIMQGPHPVGPSNTVTQCPYCQATVKTSIKHTATSRTHIISLLCWFTCCCCCIPYCMDSTRNTDHYCPLCDRYLGTYQNFSNDL